MMISALLDKLGLSQLSALCSCVLIEPMCHAETETGNQKRQV